ncbi:MAG: ribulose-phosphate 3-epimerase [Gemmatimonadota bacterium]|nr:ribulose-phosphate 3-epimerase [Gemmatimonadota bacterium]MDH5760395.1 ribulose-phosphate 3-epimerase [Gemmatimonadota bacterium]
MKIAPSILSADFGCLQEQIHAVEEGGADWIHVDVMDGHFVPNLTIGPLIVEAARRATELPLDVHLMIEAPHRYLDAFVGAGADIVTVHVEACPHLHRTVDQIRKLGARPGVALNPGTPLDTVREVMADLDLIVIMSVNPGFGGQRYIPGSTDKIRRARVLAEELSVELEIEVDGGVDSRNVGEVQDAGATVVVAGSAVYGHPHGPGAGVRALRDLSVHQG